VLALPASLLSAGNEDSHLFDGPACFYFGRTVRCILDRWIWALEMLATPGVCASLINGKTPGVSRAERAGT
jgi:hypothetical protein